MLTSTLPVKVMGIKEFGSTGFFTPTTFSLTDIIGAPKNLIGWVFLIVVLILIGAVNLTLYVSKNCSGILFSSGSNSAKIVTVPIPSTISSLYTSIATLCDGNSLS